MHKILALLLLTMTFLFSSQMGVVHSLDPNGDGFLSIRKKPKQAEIGRLYNGDRVKILSKKGKYYKIKKMSSGQVGYAHSNWIRKTSSTSTASNNLTFKTGMVTGLDPNGDGFLALRAKYKVGRQIGKLYEGDKVRILAKRAKWYKVKTVSAGQVGWAHGNWIKIVNNNPYTNYYKQQVYTSCLNDKGNNKKFNLNKYCKCDTEAVVKVYKSVDEFNSYYRTSELRYKYMARLTKYIDESYYCDTADEVETYEAKHGKIESPKINGIPLSEYDLDEKTNEPVLRKDSKYYKAPDKTAPTTDNSNKWIIPSKKICQSNGGKVDDSGYCTSKWSDAKQICSSSNGELPNIKELESVVLDCSGVYAKWNDTNKDSVSKKNKFNTNYKFCYKKLGFESTFYWSTSTRTIDEDSALVVDFNKGTEGYSSKSGSYYQPSVVCVKTKSLIIRSENKTTSASKLDLVSKIADKNIDTLRKKEEILEEINNLGFHEGVSYYKEKLPSKYKKDREIISALVSSDGRVFEYIDISFRKDKQITLDTIKYNNHNQLKYADSSLKKDKNFILSLIKGNGYLLEYADTTLKKDKEVALAAIKNNFNAMNYIDKSLTKDKDVMLAAINGSTHYIEYADISLRNDKEFMIPLIKKYPSFLEDAGISLKKNKTIVLSVVSKNGKLLQYADTSLRKDKDVVLAAVNENRYALEYADLSLQKDKDILLAVNSQRRYPVSYAIEHHDETLLKYMLKKYENNCSAEKIDSCEVLGNIYLFGVLGKVDIKKASMYYKKSKTENRLISFLNSDNYKFVDNFEKSHFYQIKACEKVYGHQGHTATIMQVKSTFDVAIEYNVECDKNSTIIGLRLDYDNDKSWFKILQVDDYKINLKNQTYYKLGKDSLVGYISESYKEKLSKKLKEVRENFDKASDSEKKRLVIAEQMLSKKGLVYSEIKQTNTLMEILKNPTMYLYDVQGYDTKILKY